MSGALKSFQHRVADWTLRVFGQDYMMDREERALRLLEEALEFGQSMGLSIGEALHLLHYVYSRPAGDPQQELGGVAVTLHAAATALGLHTDQLTDLEISRIEALPPEKFIKRNEEKKASGVGKWEGK
jgi:hypothetical protein